MNEIQQLNLRMIREEAHQVFGDAMKQILSLEPNRIRNIKGMLEKFLSRESERV